MIDKCDFVQAGVSLCLGTELFYSRLFMASNEAINNGDVRWTPARQGHRRQRPKRSHDKSRYESLEEGFGVRRCEGYSREKYTHDWNSNGLPLF